MERYTQLKDKGNQLFKQKKYEQAVVTFQEGLDLISKEHPLEKIMQSQEVGKLYVILNINAAFAELSLKTKDSYKQADLFCSFALNVEPKNHKGLYRRALANKELAELMERESLGSSEELIELYKKSKKDLEDLCVEDRTNEIAKQKLSEVIKNIYRVTVTQGKEGNLLTGPKVQQVKGLSQKAGPKVEQTKAKKSGDMNKILQEYKVDEVTSIARSKIEQHYLTQELPKSKAELEKAIREIEKSQEVFLKFIYRMDEAYLKKVQAGFEILFKLVEVILRDGEGDDAKRVLQAIRSQKAFDLLWMGYTAGEKEALRKKWQSLGLNLAELK